MDVNLLGFEPELDELHDLCLSRGEETIRCRATPHSTHAGRGYGLSLAAAS